MKGVDDDQGHGNLDRAALECVEQARRDGGPTASAFDLLVAAVRQFDSSLWVLADAAGMDRKRVLSSLAKMQPDDPQRHILVAASIDHVLDLAGEEAGALGSPAITPLHLVMATIRLYPSDAIDGVRRLLATTGAGDRPLGWTTYAPMQSLPPSPEHQALIDESDRQEREMEELGIEWPDDPGELRYVIGIGATRTVEGVTVQLTALECRTSYAVLTWRLVAPGYGAQLPGPRVRVTDDVDTRYITLRISSGGSTDNIHGETIVLPSPAPSATRISIAIEGFQEDSFGFVGVPLGPSCPLPDGPWSFVIDLSPPSESDARER